MTETPTITKANYSNRSISGADYMGAMGATITTSSTGVQHAFGASLMGAPGQQRLEERRRALEEAETWVKAQALRAIPTNQPKGNKAMSGMRVVKVYIADPNENLPLDKRVLYTGSEKLTDLEDNELFFEIPIQELLAKHNEYRATVADKRQTEKFGREIKLEPVRIRDLRMVVVDVATF